MYLKRLEILGFKSFADKIQLDLPAGVTAVVGPNGSGKSNISDAIRWVLGEQSIKNLRGAKMDDVIFAGSEIRKPLGLAEVTMTLDNSDHALALEFDEVAITRKLFRSGESEYLINKTPVRLRDIHELFYDTGVGKEAYSVIGQGKIDSILSVRAEERRMVFEEAAGIIKYKTRKQVAQRKLEETDRNLLRVKDILAELETQLGPLQAQASLAEKYLEIKESLTSLELNHYGNAVRQLTAQLETMAAAKGEAEAKFQDFEGQESLLESTGEELRLQLLNQDETIAQLNEDYYRIQNQLDKLGEQVGFLHTKKADLAKQEQECVATADLNRERQQQLRQEETGIAAAVTEIKTRSAATRQGVHEQEQLLLAQNQALTTAEEQEQEFKNQEIEVLNQIAALKNRINAAQLQQEFIAKQVAECHKKQQQINQQLSASADQTTLKQTAAAELTKALEELRQEQTHQAQQLLASQSEVEALAAKNLEWKERIGGLESKIGLLEEMERSHQGYFQGVKALLAEATAQPFHGAIKGIVADLIQVKSGMELALETALGSALQHVVISDDQAAQAAIGYLKQQSRGRATFLPLNLIATVEPNTSDLRELLEKYQASTALSLLQFAPEYKAVLAYLLGQTVVAPNLAVAIKLSRKLERSFRIVTPEGDLVTPGGAITGGSIDKRRLGLLSRRREIEDLKQERHEALAFLEKGQQNEAKLQGELERLSAVLEGSKQQEQQLNLEKISLDQELQSINQAVERHRQELEAYTGQLAELEEEAADFSTNRTELEVSLTAKQAELQKIQTESAGVTAGLQTAQQEKEAILARMAELKSQLSASQQEEQGKQELQQQLTRQLESLEQLLQELQTKQQQLQAETAQTQQLIVDLTKQQAAERDGLAGQEERINQAKQGKEDLLQQLKELEGRQRSLRRKNNDYQNQLHRYDLQLSQINLQIENIQQNLAEDYGDDWLERSDPQWVDPGDALPQIEGIKNDLRELGAVNLGAIDDYHQIQQRYEFLTAQSQDLFKASESLQRVINEIERTIRKRFSDSLQLVRTQFKKIFADLFEGGNADLFLIDPENPLESGIEITAQPPGKRLQSLLLLSGGERAMTAIALLFAILAVKPSPFCILDEIDATLDEANVARFAKLLELFSRELQFIVVTHRRGTMEIASTIYGVTMEELGVSKLLSLDLRAKAG